MARRAHVPFAHGVSRPSAADTAGTPSLTGLNERFVQDLPPFPSRAALLALTDRELPSTDGLPMPDSMRQNPHLNYMYNAFRRFFRDRSDVCVAVDLLVYAAGPEDAAGRVRAVSVAPDVLVAFGVDGRLRDSWVIWQEGKAPDFVLEVASESTWKRDRDEKPAIYASLGVAEYFLFDPVGGHLAPRLQGYALRDGTYRALPVEVLADGERGVRSAVLGLCAYLRGPEQVLRWRDPATGQDLEDPEEVETAREAAAAARRAAEDRAARETAARREAEDRAARETAARREAEDRAARETAARETEAAARRGAENRAARETAARREAEKKNAALLAEIRRLRRGPDT